MGNRRLVAGLGLALVAVLGATAVATTGGTPEQPRAAAPTETPSTPSGPPLLLPDLRSVAAEDLRVEQAGDARLLRFSASLANLGPGPLLLRPEQPDQRCPAGRHPARQVVYRDAGDDGRYRQGRDRPLQSRHAGCMLRHPGHDHWHFDAMASYVLRDARTGAVVASRPKVSFCLRDNRRVRGVATTVRREHFGDCTRTGPQGISPGWVDVYSWDLDGQTLPLPASEARRQFCLELTADPRGLVLEADEHDNATAVGLAVEGATVTRLPELDC